MKQNYIVLDGFHNKSNRILQLVTIDDNFEMSDIKKSLPMNRSFYTETI